MKKLDYLFLSLFKLFTLKKILFLYKSMIMLIWIGMVIMMLGQNFPSDENTYRKILMHYDMRCSSSGCSGWDYTTQKLV